MPGVRVAVPAKVNLYLRVLGRRKDGYHTVRTVLHTVGLFDEIRIYPARTFCFTASGHPVPRGAGNLCVRAYAMLREFAGSPEPARLHLIKRIPLAAGLGGGSADAGACLRGLARFWRLKIAEEKLAALARRLGSDVPFFLKGCAAIGTGRGDRLRPVSSRISAWAVILKPAYSGPTHAAYRELDRRRGRTGTARGGASLAETLSALKRGSLAHLKVRNDFTGPAVARHPKTARMLSALQAAGAATAFLSGSGSAIVGLIRTRAAADRMARWAGRRLGVRVWVAAFRPLKLRISGPKNRTENQACR